jgi:hypothetical protein
LKIISFIKLNKKRRIKWIQIQLQLMNQKLMNQKRFSYLKKMKNKNKKMTQRKKPLKAWKKNSKRIKLRNNQKKMKRNKIRDKLQIKLLEILEYVMK